MDSQQADRIHVYGFIYELMRDNPGLSVARIIEPPNVALQTNLNPAVYATFQGGPFLIAPAFGSAVSLLMANTTFSKLTITYLTAPFSSNQILSIQQPTQILVISDGYWGKTFLTLTRIGISYTQISTDQALADPSIVNQYSLIILDSPGWYGNPSAYSPLHRQMISAVYAAIRSQVSSGAQVIYTDAAIFDLNSTFPGYVQLGSPGETGYWKATVYDPPNGFGGDFESQYYNPGPNPNSGTVFTEEGSGNWVPTGVLSGEVRVLMDTTNYGAPQLGYAIMGFYFPYGNGIVAGFALQPYEQLYPLYADYNGYYAVYQMYGNEFLGSPSSQTLVSGETAAPLVITSTSTQTISSTVFVTSIATNTLSSTSVALQTVSVTVAIPSTSVATTVSTGTQTNTVLVTNSMATTSTAIQTSSSTATVTSVATTYAIATVTSTSTSIQPQTSLITSTTGVASTTVTSTATSTTTVNVLGNTSGLWLWVTSALFFIVGVVLLFHFRSRFVRKPVTCPKCGSLNPTYAERFCVKCGEPLLPNEDGKTD